MKKKLQEEVNKFSKYEKGDELAYLLEVINGICVSKIDKNELES